MDRPLKPALHQLDAAGWSTQLQKTLGRHKFSPLGGRLLPPHRKQLQHPRVVGRKIRSPDHNRTLRRSELHPACDNAADEFAVSDGGWFDCEIGLPVSQIDQKLVIVHADSICVMWIGS